MSLVSTNKLSELTGRTHRTIKSRLESLIPIKEGRSLLYETKEALPLIYDVGIIENGALDLTEERARLAHHQANKTKLEEKVLRGDLIPAETVSMVQTKMLSAFRAKCLSIPTKTAPRVVFLSELAEVESELRQSIYDALSELSEFSPEQYGITVVDDDIDV